MKIKKLSIIIPTYNEEKTINKKCTINKQHSKRNSYC